MKKSDQLVYQLVEQLKKGELKKGDKLPSIRQLAQEFHCNKETVQRALGTLKQQQYIYAVEKSGHYVLRDVSKVPIKQEQSTLPREVQFPLSDFQLCVNEALVSRKNLMLGSSQELVGCPELVTTLQQLLADGDVYAKPEQLMVVDRIQQVLYLLMLALKQQVGKKILLEQPTYHHMNRLVVALEVPYQVIDRTPEGIDLVELERLFATGEIACFYIIPHLHYPLGGSLSEEVKQKIVALAKRYQVVIIEDDYMADFERENSAPLHYYDTAGQVIYLKTFSAIMFPSFRLGVAVLPPIWHQKLTAQKELMGYDENYLLQKSLSIYIENGMYQKHKKCLITLYRQKQQLAMKVLQQTKQTAYWHNHTVVIFPLKESSNLVKLKQFVAQEPALDLLERTYLTNCPYQYVKVDVRQMEITAIEQELARLLLAIQPFIN